MTPPTVSRDGPGLIVDGLHGGPYGIGPGAARVLLRGRQFAHLLTADEDGNGVPGGLAYATEGDALHRYRARFPASARTGNAVHRMFHEAKRQGSAFHGWRRLQEGL